jgi:hypothetical protein
VVGDLFKSLVGDAPTACHIPEERDDVVLTLGSSEARQQERVVGDGNFDVFRATGGGGGCVEDDGGDICGSYAHTSHPPTAPKGERPFARGRSRNIPVNLDAYTYGEEAR